jgi:hypothetical protein
MWGVSGGVAGFAPGGSSGDGLVNVIDLIALLAQWDDSVCNAAGGVPTSVEDCHQKYSSPADQARCIEKLCEAGIIATGCP